MVLKNVKLDSLLVSYLDSAGVDVVPGGLETELLKSSVKVKWSRSVMSDSSGPHGLQPTRLLHPWEFPGKSTGVGCHCLLWKSSVSKLNLSLSAGWLHFLQQVLPRGSLLFPWWFEGLDWTELAIQLLYLSRAQRSPQPSPDTTFQREALIGSFCVRWPLTTAWGRVTANNMFWNIYWRKNSVVVGI